MAAAVFACAALTQTQPPPEPPAAPAIDELVADLASPEFPVRDHASYELLNSPSIRLEDLERILSTQQLAPEAHARLVNAARERFCLAPRAAMGVEFNQSLLRDRIVIGRTIGAFPCTRLLEPGDIIIEADGVDLAGPGGRPAIQGLIISRDPGHVMKLVVRRGRDKLNIDVPLGRFNDLPQSGGLDDVRLFRAWRARSREYLPPLGDDEPITVPIHKIAWPGTDDQARQRQLIQAKLNPQGAAMVVQAGGRARVSNLASDPGLFASQLRIGNAQRMNAWVGVNPIALQRMLDFDDPSTQPPMTLEEELVRLDAARLPAEAEVEQLRKQLLRATTDKRPFDVAAATERVAEAERRLRALTRQREALLAERAERDAAAGPN